MQDKNYSKVPQNVQEKEKDILQNYKVEIETLASIITDLQKMSVQK
jgi:hypothetical protein